MGDIYIGPIEAERKRATVRRKKTVFWLVCGAIAGGLVYFALWTGDLKWDVDATTIIAFTLVLSPLLPMTAYAIFLKIQRNKAGLPPVVTGREPIEDLPYVGAYGARESWSDMSIKD
jgi:hypothetical protein